VSGRRPGTEGPPDFPLMTERVDDPADAPAMLVSHPGRRGGTSVHRLVENSFRVTDHQQHPAGCPADRQRAEAVPVRPGRCRPERGIPDGELGNDVVSFANTVKDSRAERGLIESNSRTGSIQPQLRLYSSHEVHDKGGRTRQATKTTTGSRPGHDLGEGLQARRQPVLTCRRPPANESAAPTANPLTLISAPERRL